MDANTLPAAEIKRRGMAAIEEGLQRGPVHIVKHNKPAAVVLSEADYQRPLGQQLSTTPPVTALQRLLTQKPAGQRKRKDIEAELQAQRTW